MTKIRSRKKFVAIVIIAIAAMTSSPSSQAASKVTTYISNFKKMLSTSNNQLDALDAQHEKDIDAEDAKLAEATNLALKTYQDELVTINSLYAPQIAAANQKALDAKDLFNKNNKIKVGSSGGFFGGTNLANYLDCPNPILRSGYTYELAKRYCTNTYGYLRFGDKSPTNSQAIIGGEDWQIGDETTIQLANADQPLVLNGFSNGYIVAINQTVFDSSRIEYKNQISQVDSLTTRQGNARTAASNKKEASIAKANSARDAAVQELENTYQENLSKLQSDISVQEKSILAAQRASKDPNNFAQAFATAYKFEFNRAKLNEIADMPWTGFWTFRTINTLIKVSKLADQADLISSKYSYKTALNFNNLIAGAFTNDSEFRFEMKSAQSIYATATGSNIKLQ